MEKHTQRTIISFTTGFLLGACLSVISIVVFYFYQEAKPLSLPVPSQMFLSTPTASKAIVFTPTGTVILIPTPTVDNILMIAESYILEGRVEEAKELILSEIDNWELGNDKARGYKLLGDGETYIGHYQLAAPYYEKMYFYEPTPENLYIVAINYDLAGDLCSAYEKYQKILSMDDIGENIDLELIKARVEDIKCSIKINSP